MSRSGQTFKPFHLMEYYLLINLLYLYINSREQSRPLHILSMVPILQNRCNIYDTCDFVDQTSISEISDVETNPHNNNWASSRTQITRCYFGRPFSATSFSFKRDRNLFLNQKDGRYAHLLTGSKTSDMSFEYARPGCLVCAKFMAEST